MYGTWEVPDVCEHSFAYEEKRETQMGNKARLMAFGNSDRVIVLEKLVNKADKHAAESMEGRTLTERNDRYDAGGRTLSRVNTMSRLSIVREVARKDKRKQFSNLMHHLTVDLLRESFNQLERRSSAGIDGIRWKDYEVNLEDNLLSLHAKVQGGRYRPRPARRVFIPKEDGSERPLSVLCLEDKIVQQAVVSLLNTIYEGDFLGFSYGFRPGRNQHMALDALTVGLYRKRINWILDLDIAKFFDTVEHEWLIRFVEHRIRDKRILRLITQWLKVGFADKDGRRVASQAGTPQGGVISPLLANIYLHYAFDLWVQKWRKEPNRKESIVVRYADDGVLGFQTERDAKECLCAVKERLGKFGLALHSEKTRLIRFGRFAAEQCKALGLPKPEPFNFLGFTHCCGTTRNGSFIVKRLTAKKRMRKQIKGIAIELKRRLHQHPKDVGKWLRTVVQGHMNYYSVPLNSRSISGFCYEVKCRWYKALCRRSQRKKINWTKFAPLADYWIPKPRIMHPYPEKRFDARYST